MSAEKKPAQPFFNPYSSRERPRAGPAPGSLPQTPSETGPAQPLRLKASREEPGESRGGKKQPKRSSSRGSFFANLLSPSKSRLKTEKANHTQGFNEVKTSLSDSKEKQSTRRNIFGSFGGLLGRLSHRNRGADKQEKSSEAVNDAVDDGRLVTQLASPDLLALKTPHRIPGAIQTNLSNHPPPRGAQAEFTGKFTSNALMQKISANIQQNRAIEDLITASRVGTSRPADIRWATTSRPRGLTSRTDKPVSEKLSFINSLDCGPTETKKIVEIDFKKIDEKKINKRLEKSLGRGRSSSRRRSSSKEGRGVLKQTYYMKNLEYYLGLKNKSKLGKAYCEHFLQSLAAIKYVQKLRPVSDEAIYKSQVNCHKMDEKLSMSRFSL